MFLRVSLLLALTSCALPGEDFEASSGAELLSTRDVIGVLALVNDEATDFERLDDDVALDRRAAAGIIERRNGEDGLVGTGDDQPFESIEAIDALPWVGPSALRRLQEYALASGFVPSDDSPHGIYDGVAFTFWEADSVLALVNAASDEELRAAGVSSRSIPAIMAARPIESMETLASLNWIGTRTLEKLRDTARPTSLDCRTTADCDAGFRCQGRPNGFEFGRCRDTTSYPGVQDDCDTDADCNAHLVCIAQSVYGQGYCADEWMRDMFVTSPRRTLAAHDASLSFSLVVYGQASVPEDFAITLDLEHTDPTSLWIGLQPPTGQEAVTLWDGASDIGPLPARFVDRELYRDDEVNGEYQLLIENRGGRGEGTLRSFGFAVSSRWD